ncbi:MAG: hypothetical protein UR52_C0008G0016 [Candidatus Gottesmanbacteria bacterium GW2011_GWA1_34_13]|uniref:Uncharacterized protein n=1 Tax=Candidatus Gottesmanbacteria bacterium GW2011_GWA1_34_13 TaxID=1618434 RepID=A0A0G0B6G9_9BACT|nr:MAG: hypothetical protein UR52_C0008G0016 [Candidatus Gottesmanbacteria bacterium GW2011_GWA1_34_13]
MIDKIYYEPNPRIQLAKLLNRDWHLIKVGNLSLHLPLNYKSKEISSQLEFQKKELIHIANALEGLNNGQLVNQRIVFCPPDFYNERFQEKAAREKFDPKPWIDWSEGDVETVNSSGDIFFINTGANFLSNGDRLRFFAHELTHSIISQKTKIFSEFLADAEGIAEADARLGLSLQTRSDMIFSSKFITDLNIVDLVPANNINRQKYDHPKFIAKTVSLNPGYVNCFLWFAGQAFEIAQSDSGNIVTTYITGRNKLLEIAANSKSIEEYIFNLKQIGFDYKSESKKIDLILKTQKRLKAELII